MRFPSCHVFDGKITIKANWSNEYSLSVTRTSLQMFTFSIRPRLQYHQSSSCSRTQSTSSIILQTIEHSSQRKVSMADSMFLSFLPHSLPQTLIHCSDSSMESKPTLPSTRAAKVHPKPLALPNAAEATTKAKVERFLQRTAMLQELQGRHNSNACCCRLRLIFIFRG